LVALPGELGKVSGRRAGRQLWGCDSVLQPVQGAVKALPEGAAPEKSSIFLKETWSQKGRQCCYALWTKREYPSGARSRVQPCSPRQGCRSPQRCWVWREDHKQLLR